VHILVIEDHPQMAAFLKQGLSESGFTVQLAGNGHDGEALAVSQKFDLIILDLMLPDGSGTQICHNLRRREIKTPILILTALSSTTDKVENLNAGADDYLIKPFEFDELIARLRALHRRGANGTSTLLKYSDIEMDLAHRLVRRQGQKIRLTTKEFALLEFFMRNPEQILSRASISQKVWDISLDLDSNVIDVYISMLRRKLDRNFETPVIQTVVGSGYVLSSKLSGH
jgi:DNA-binding response OmpR family regulator